MNLIGKSTEDDFDQRHILDCIQIHNYIGNTNLRILDVGTGAGLPGILLSILGFKNIHLVEKSPKKSNFLNNCKLRLGVEFTVHNNLIEKLKTTKFDVVVARAFAPIVKIISVTINITDSKTKYILLKGKSFFQELESLDQSKYNWHLYPSLTSNESKIVVIHSK
jgi:16S rRNA (guanine(527)-N(7))-methyltransferase RsmG